MYKNIKCKLGLLALAISLGLTGCDLDGKDGDQGLIGIQGEQGVAGNNGNDGKTLPRSLNVEVVGRFATGIYGKSAAEIVQFHKSSNSAFAINGATNQIEVINLANLSVTASSNPTSDESLSSSAFTFPLSVSVKSSSGFDKEILLAAVNSIAIKDNLLAIAVEGQVKQNNGAILFYRLNELGEGALLKPLKQVLYRIW